MHDGDEALRRARDFADTSYADAVSRSTKDLQYQLALKRNEYAARGILRSGNMLHASAKLYGKHIDDLVLARIESLLEGYELHNVLLDESLAERTVNEVMRLKDALLLNAKETVTEVDRGGGLFTPVQFAEYVNNECKVSRSSVVTIAERQRLRPNKPGATSTIYQVSGYARVNVNSTDNSVNVITLSQDQIFAKLRHEITTHVQAGPEQEEILQRLSALEAAQNSHSFAERYVDLISVAANHMTLLAPFLPALADMVRNAVK